MAKPKLAHAPHWGIGDVTLGDRYGSPFWGDAYKWPLGATRPLARTSPTVGRTMPMSGSPSAVKIHPSPLAPSTRAEGSVAQLGPKVPRSTGALSKIAWVPQRGLGHSDWLAAGRRLGAIGRCSQWWIGDWVRYGTSRWGEKYAEAARVTGYDVASLRNMAWVASRFDLSLRNDKLTWSHHVLLAPLDSEEQRRWLQRASEERLSVADLRLELRALRDSEERKPSGGATVARDSGELAVCPHCGHSLSSP
jgi:hypothetical protein